MSLRNAPVKRESRRAWISGLAITLTALTALFGFWRLAPGATFIVALIAAIGLVIALWVAGKPG